MTANPQPPPEAALIAERRDAMIPRLSMRQAAQRMGVPFSAARWRQLESGIRRVGGTDFPETGPAETIARMARVVGITPVELTNCGRLDAAHVLAALPPPEQSPATIDDLREIVRRQAEALDQQEQRIRKLEGNGDDQEDHRNAI